MPGLILVILGVCWFGRAGDPGQARLSNPRRSSSPEEFVVLGPFRHVRQPHVPRPRYSDAGAGIV